MNLSGSATSMGVLPLAARAFRFLDPITAPTPEPPAAFALSVMMHAERTRFSPAGPMPETRTSLSPCSSLMDLSASQVVAPQRCDASLSWASPSSIHR